MLGLASEWRAENMAEKAGDYADAGQWLAAEAEAKRALQLNRSSHDALSVLFRASLQNGRDDTLRIGAALFSHPLSSAGDKAMVLDLLLLTGDHIGFRRLQSSLPPELLSDPAILMQSIRFQAIRGDRTMAIQKLEQYLEVSDDPDENFRILHADLLMQSGEWEQAVKIVDGLVAENGDEVLSAFRLLGRIPFEKGADLPLDGIIAVVSQRSDMTVTDELLLAGIQMSRAGSSVEADKILRVVVNRFLRTDPEAVARWLDNVGRQDYLEKVVSVEAARKSTVLAGLYLKGLMTSGRYKEAKEWMEKVGSVFDGTRASTTNAVIALKLGDRPSALVNWRNAMHEAGIRNDGNIYLKMAHLAMVSGAADWAVEAMMEASQRPETLISAGIDHSGYIGYLLREDRLSEAVELARYWLAREPESPALRNNLLYLQLLSGAAADSALEQTGKLHEVFPGTLGFQTTHALALALSGELEAARETLSGAPLDWSRAGDVDRAIRELVLNGAVNPTSLARLSPPEKRLLGSDLAADGL